jgi:hypothetical protein
MPPRSNFFETIFDPKRTSQIIRDPSKDADASCLPSLLHSKLVTGFVWPPEKVRAMPRVLQAQRKTSPVTLPEANIVPTGLNLVVVMGSGAWRQASMVSGRPVSRRISA